MCDLLNDMTPHALAVAWPIALWAGIWPYLLMVAGFSVIIFVHEFGHFMVAKWSGVRVERFAIGFGREIVGFTRGETRYSFNLLPLGGYVKMLGQEDFDSKSEELQFKDNPRSFINKPVGHRMAIVSAGVIMNVLFACFLFMIVFLVGMETMGTRIAYIEPDSPAERAGLLPGDEIRKINGDTVLGFSEVKMAIMLAPLHVPNDFLIERDGELKSISVASEFLIPENTREARRLMVGISPGVTPEITRLGPEIDGSRTDHPHVGDVLVEIGGVQITEQNANAMINALAYARGDIWVERHDPDNPDASPQRVRVSIPPRLTLHTQDRTGAVSVLGLAPLVRFDAVDRKGNARLSGIDVGDTVLNWNDVEFPTRSSIARAIRENPERDIYFKVLKDDGRVLTGFVRPKRHKRGAATIQAICESLNDDGPPTGAPRAKFSEISPHGRAHRAGIKPGDVVLSCQGIEHPSRAEVNRAIRGNAYRDVHLTLQHADGQARAVVVLPEPPGSIDASFNLVADDLLRVADILPEIAGEPSPAHRAGLSPGIFITAVDGKPVLRWRELIEEFQAGAGRDVQLTYRGTDNSTQVAAFHVPHGLRTLLGAGPEARILSIDGQKTVQIDTSRGREEVAVGYREGTRTILSELVGKTGVPVVYRPNPISPLQTAYVDVTQDMVNPWLGYVVYQPSIDVAPELTLLKGETAIEAVQIGLLKTYYFILQVYKMLDRMIFTRSVSADNISGPLGIIDIGGRMARAGFVDFVFFMAIISANLAVLNFLPLPIVDGGLMVFLIIEKIKGTPVSIRVQVATQVIGLFLIIGAFLFVTFNDAMRLWG